MIQRPDLGVRPHLVGPWEDVGTGLHGLDQRVGLCAPVGDVHVSPLLEQQVHTRRLQQHDRRNTHMQQTTIGNEAKSSENDYVTGKYRPHTVIVRP